MKNIIKDLIDELISDKAIVDLKYTKASYEKMEGYNAITVNGDLLYWQKSIQNDRILLIEPNTKDYLVLEDVELSRFRQFFEYAPVLEELFKLEGTKVVYNKELSAEEIQEVLEYIDENYKITRRAGNRKTII